MGLVQILRDAPPDRQTFQFAGTLAITLGNLVYYNTNTLDSVGNVTNQGTIAKNIAFLAPKFCGVAADTRTVNETNALTDFPVDTDVVVEMDCPSQTWEKGDLVTFANNAGLPFNQQLDKTTDPALAIGYCTKRAPNATTRVQARLIANYVPNRSRSETMEIAVPIYPGTGTTRTLTTFRENLTLVAADVEIDVAQNIVGTLVKAATNAAPAAGTTPWCNANAINFNTAANTTQALTLTATVADLNVIPTDKAALVFNAALNTGQALVTMRFIRSK